MDAAEAEQAAAAAEREQLREAEAGRLAEARAADALETTVAGVTPAPAGTVRATVDVPLAAHRRLNRLADDVAEDLDVPSVTRQDLLAAAIAELLMRDSFGDELRARITRRVRELQRARE